MEEIAKTENKNHQQNESYPNYSERKQSNSFIPSEKHPHSVQYCKRDGRRKSSILPILKDQAPIKPFVKYKPFLPIPCQLVTLRIVVPISIVFVWLILIPPIAHGLYKEIANNSSVQVNNDVSFLEKLLSTVNLSQKSVECPEMYTFLPAANSCRPKCGFWSGCGAIMHCVERFAVIIIDCGGLLFGVYGIISQIVVFKEWQLKQLGIIVTAHLGVLLSPIFLALDLPGQRYLYCSGEEVALDEVKVADNIQVQIFAVILHYVSTSFVLWLFFALLNIALLQFFSLSARLQSNSFLGKVFAFEFLFGFGIPILLIGSHFGIGERYNLENVIQHPSIENNRGNFFSIHAIIFILAACVTTILMILYKTQIGRLHLQTCSAAPLKMSGLERRFIVVCICYMSVMLLRGVYSTYLSFSPQWEAQNREYAACITLKSSFSLHSPNSIITPPNSSLVAGLLDIELRDQISECTHACIIPFKTILIRLTWIIVFSITTNSSSFKVWHSILLKPFKNKKTQEKPRINVQPNV